MRKKIKVYSYYFPNWHADARNEKWHGKGWTEWEVTKCARPRFEGHHQPRIPLWGYEDESDPKVMEKKIATALKYGIDGFIFDTYYYADGSYRLKCLNEGFLKAKNCQDIEFGILWCNHDAIYAHPSPKIGVAPSVCSSVVTEEQFIKITNYFIEHYFKLPNYIRIEGKVYFAIYNVEKLTRELGGEKECARIFNDFRQRVRDAGLGELHLATVAAIIEDVTEDKKEINRIVSSLGVDENVRYWWPVKYKDTRLTVDYYDFLKAGIEATLEDQEVFEIPSIAHVMSGLDQSPRTIQSEVYENLNLYPWYAIVINHSPIAYEIAFKEMRKIALSDKYRGTYITTIWNEWTEGNYLEPEFGVGYAYLEAIKKVLDEEKENDK